MCPTEGSGLSQPWSSHSKDIFGHNTERTARHGPRITSSQKGSSRSVHPAEAHKHMPPSSNTPLVPEKPRKRIADTATVMTTKQSRTTSSSGKESTARGGWKPLNKPHKGERGEPLRAKSSVGAQPHLTTEQSYTSKIQAPSHQRPKRLRGPPQGPPVFRERGALLPHSV